MHPIDTYLDAIRRRLPRATRDDVIAELRDALLTEMEAAQAEHGRDLTTGEIDQLLARFGAPRAVAARYGARSYLIGPRMYPVFMFVAKAFVCVIGVIALIRITIVSWGAEAPLAAAAGVVIPAFVMIVLWISLAAIILARAEQLPLPQLPWETWIPRTSAPHVPVLSAPGRRTMVPRRETVSSLATLTFWLLGWAGALPLGEWMLWRWLPIAPTQIWTDLTPYVIGLLVAGIAVDAIALAQPRLVRLHEAAQVVTSVGLLVVIGLALRAWPLVVPAIAGARADKAASVTNVVLILSLAGLALFSIACVAAIVRCWMLATPGHRGRSATTTL
jgi:hypothetical protein